MAKQLHSKRLFSSRLTGLSKTVRLAYVLGSLVRVSRRVGWRPTYSHHCLHRLLAQSPPMSGNTAPSCCARRHKSADRKSTRLNSSHVSISYAVFCLKKKSVKTYA